jgi:L-rhamnose mutarotase
MSRIAFKMTLYPGFAEEYQRRHEALWPELKALLKQSGISDYSIFLDEETYALFAIFKADDAKQLNELPENPVMKRWWAYMRDLMETNADDTPVAVPLKEVFYLA